MGQPFGDGWQTRRSFLRLLGVAGATAGLSTGVAEESTAEIDQATEDGLGTLSFYSTASQIAADGQSELTDDDIALVRASPSATNVNNVEGSDDGIIYEETAPPVVSEDDGVVGIGTVNFVSDGNGGFTQDNEQFLLNLFEDKIGPDSTVAWDASHGQEWTLDDYDSFSAYAADEGYDLREAVDLLSGTASLQFPSTASQVAPGGDAPLTDPEHVLLWAEPTATNVDNEGDGAFIYDEEPIPLASRADNVVGFGTPDVLTDENLTDANEQFLLALLEATVGDGGTILWDDGHGTAYSSDSVTEFSDSVEASGYGFEATTNLLGGDGGDIEQLEFFSTASLVAPDGSALTDDSLIAVWAEETAYTNGDTYRNSGDDAGTGPDIPLVAVDDAVVGVGATFANDASDVAANRAAVVNAWEDRLGGTGTVLYDESHGQNLTLDGNFSQLKSTAEDRGFTVDAIGSDGDFEAALDGADAVMIATDNDDLASAGGFTEAERTALADFVADGGGLFVHDTSDFEGDSTAELNAVVEAVGADFRFNSDQVSDDENNDGRSFVPQTTVFNDADYPAFFAGEEGTDPITIEDADLLAVASPQEAYTDEELAAVSDHVDNGGAVFLFDESEFTNEETANLNAIADDLGLPFAFNPDQVEDAENNAGQSSVPTTTNFNDAFDLFDGLQGIGLDEADGLVVTTPPTAFSDEELTAVTDFVANDGSLFLFDQSEFRGYEETANLNAIADALDLAFRFNADQVEDAESNVGSAFDIATANYDAEDDRFTPRENGIGIEFQRGETYDAKVVQVYDGDTFDVEFDGAYGYTETIRHLGIDTAETGSSENATEEWFGIPDDELDHLGEWGNNATDYALDLMAPDGAAALEEIDGRHVQIAFDDEESIRGNFGRLLCYVSYDESAFQPDFETADFETDYTRQIVADGYARVYSSGFGRHDEFSTAEARALADRRGVWSAADFETISQIGNDPVQTAFVPRATAVTGANGALDEDRIVATGSDTAEASVPEDRPALIGADKDARVAAVGGLSIREEYENGDGDEYPQAPEHQTYPLLANIVDELSASIGPVLLDGGHGQFSADGALSLERCQFFLRYLEGVDTRLRQINDLSTLAAEPVTPRAMIITPPAEPYSRAELDALAAFRDDGGTVLLVGSSRAPAEHRQHLNEIAAALGSELRLSDEQVTDSEQNVGGNSELLVTDAFNDSWPLYDPADLDGQYVTTRARSLANDADRIGLNGLRRTIDDWQADRIDTTTLQAIIDLWSKRTPVFPDY